MMNHFQQNKSYISFLDGKIFFSFVDYLQGASSAASQARDKLMERQEKLEVQIYLRY